jgi:flagellar motor switch protein FliN/FliY
VSYTTYETPGGILEEAPDVLRVAAAVAGRSLPASAEIVAGEPQLLAERPPLLNAPGAQAVAVAVTGAATGVVTFVVADDVAAAVRSGPLGADELTAALAAPVADAVSDLETVFGGPLHAGIAEAIIAEALDFPADAVIVPLLDGQTIVAALVVELVGTGYAVADSSSAAEAATGETAEFTAFVEERTEPAVRSLDLLHDVEMAVTVELGRTRMLVKDLLSLAPGAVVELDRAAGSPVDVLVNGKLIARGEVVVIDDDFGIRISEILGLQPGRS